MHPSVPPTCLALFASSANRKVPNSNFVLSPVWNLAQGMKEGDLLA
jgi:hypothetical protein